VISFSINSRESSSNSMDHHKDRRRIEVCSSEVVDDVTVPMTRTPLSRSGPVPPEPVMELEGLVMSMLSWNTGMSASGTAAA